jgi:hypothetical protein
MYCTLFDYMQIIFSSEYMFVADMNTNICIEWYVWIMCIYIIKVNKVKFQK